MNMIEKMARAIGEARGVTWDERNVYYRAGPLGGADEGPTDEYYRLAKAALTTLLEPDEGMVEAMRLCTIRNSRPVDPNRPFESPFTAAIQHALAEGE